MPDKRATLLLTLKDKVSKGMTKIGTKLDRVGKSISQTRLGFIAAGVAVSALGLAVIKAAGQFEQWTISFTTMLGSADRAKILLNEIKEFAKETPFDLPQVVKGGRALLAFGIEADKVIPTMKALGDVSAGLGVPMERLILNFGQVKAQAKLTGRELRDFAIAGVPLLATLAKNLNKTEAEISSMVSAGAIGFKEVEDAFLSMSGEGGRFANLMSKQMESLEGKFSNVKDVIFQVAVELGNTLLPLAKEFLDVIIRLGGKILELVSDENDLLSVNELALIQTEERIILLEQEISMIESRRRFKNLEAIEDRKNSLEGLKRIRNDLKFKIASEKALAEERKKIRKQDVIEKIKVNKFEEFLNSKKLKNTEIVLGQISSLSNSKNKELAIVGKASAIALSTINTLRGMTLALATIPYPFSLIAASAVGVAGFATISQIAGVQLAEGGIVKSSQGGTTATIGEGGSDEAVIPLDDDEATEKLGGVGGLTINIGTLIGSEDNVEELARIIDRELFNLRANNETVSF